MVTESGLNLKQIIDSLRLSRPNKEPILYKDWTRLEDGREVWRKDEFRCELHWHKVKLYEVDAEEFLALAKHDLEEDTDGGRINALTNANRAIRCRVDEILTLSMFKGFSSRHRWNLPYKMGVLRTFGVPTPDIVKRLIISKRNLLEHRYVRPKEQQESQDAVEVAELLLEASRPYVEKGYIASAIITYTTHLYLVDELVGLSEYKEYKLVFDLESEAITLEYSRKFQAFGWKPSLKTSKIRMAEKVKVVEKAFNRVPWEKGKEEGPITIPIRDCKMEEVRELMTLLRERCTKEYVEGI